ncbi:unnamed protein product [marine sediment metagenome]|uniref:Uncharacterized protein n=1 Tax=marine sediment metagenome TaxID=412755 RepID=X1QNB9_9ZZZZ
MLVTQITQNQYKIVLTDEEMKHMRIIMLGTDHMLVTSVESLIGFILTWTEQHWYDTVAEPPMAPLNQPPIDSVKE